MKGLKAKEFERYFLSNLIAPEHLEILTENPHDSLDKIRNVGAVFIRKYSPVTFDDSSVGINHMLLTGGYARIFSGLSIWSFLKTVNFLECDATGYQKLKDVTVTLARLEGLEGHAESVLSRGG